MSTRTGIPPRPDTSSLHPDDLLTRSEAAGYLRVAVRTLRDYEADGRLCPVRLGDRLVRYRWRDLQALLQEAR